MHLNEQQRHAIEHVDGPLLILAGAGTGKTRVITERAARLVRHVKVPPSQILCVTFTNKASREMRERIEKRLGTGGSRKSSGRTGGRSQRPPEMDICTFHSLGARILRQHADRVGLRRGFSIYSQSDQLTLVRSAMRDIGEAGNKPERVHFRISRAKNDGTRPVRDGDEGEIAAEIFDAYNRLLRQCNAVDFDDLQSLALHLLETFVDVRQQLRDRWHYIQVDEYQDTNAIQLRMLQELGGGHRNVCVVGDDDQSIYGWRGAQVRNILEFDRTFAAGVELKVVRLEDNYRSTGHILAAANAVISHNPVRAEKTLRAQRGQGEPLRVIAADDDTEEARAVVRRVLYRTSRGDHLADCAILFRTAARARPFEEQLRDQQIPYVLIGGQRYFERKEVRDAVAWISLLVNERDDAALMRVINYPTRGIGKSSLDALAALAVQRRCSLASVLRSATATELCEAGAADKGARAVVALADLLAACRWKLTDGSSVTGAVTELLAAVRLEQAIAHEYRRDTAEINRRQQNVRSLLDSLTAFLARRDVHMDGRAPTLVDWLERVALIDDQDSTDAARERDALVLITIHSCKGLEFRHVFLVGFEEGVIPHSRSEAESDDGLDEERRLAYVAMTRAMDSLTLSYCLSRQQYGREKSCAPSRFLAEIPPDCFETERAEVDRKERFSAFLDKLKDAIE